MRKGDVDPIKRLWSPIEYQKILIRKRNKWFIVQNLNMWIERIEKMETIEKNLQWTLSIKSWKVKILNNIILSSVCVQEGGGRERNVHVRVKCMPKREERERNARESLSCVRERWGKGEERNPPREWEWGIHNKEREREEEKKAVRKFFALAQ